MTLTDKASTYNQLFLSLIRFVAIIINQFLIIFIKKNFITNKAFVWQSQFNSMEATCLWLWISGKKKKKKKKKTGKRKINYLNLRTFFCTT